MNLTKIQIDALNNCVKCSICVNSCPVSSVNPQFPGPKQLGVDWLRLAQEEQGQPRPSVDYCSNCKTCEAVCPSGVLVGTLNQLAKSNLPQRGLGMREEIFSDPSLLGRFIHIWPQAGNMATGLRPVKFLTERTVGISSQSPMPAYSMQTFKKMARRYKTKFSETPKEVIYFPGCFTQYNQPKIGMSLVKILSKLNYKVIVPDFKCCGQPAISNARLDKTKKFAEHNLDILRQELIDGRPLIFSCPSCLLTFKEEYKNILGFHEYSDFTSSMQDAGQFLLNHREQLAALLRMENTQSAKYAYHEPCHLRVAGQGTPGLVLLRSLMGLDITPLEAGCCGMAGSYGLKAEKEWVSREIGNSVKDAVISLNPQAVITECGMCSVQINSLTELAVKHPLEMLAEQIKA